MASTELRTGQRVRVVQRGTLEIGGVTLRDNIFEGVVIVGRDDSGNYLVKGIIKTPETDVVSIPPEWIAPV